LTGLAYGFKGISIYPMGPLIPFILVKLVGNKS